MGPTPTTMLRRASPNEQRTISRENLGFYHAVIIGATYDSKGGFDATSPRSFFGPLARCIKHHPFMSVLIADRNTDKSFYHRAVSINLEDNLTILDQLPSSSHPSTAIESLLQSEIDRPFSHTIPPWRLIILPLSPTSFFAAYSYSHSIADGPSGVAFHKTFLSALQDATTPSSSNPQPLSSTILNPPSTPLPPPFDTPTRLPISWSFLLGPLLAALLPSYLSKLLNISASAATADTNTWIGTPCTFNPPDTNTRLLLRTIPASLVDKVLKASRANGAKLTATFHLLVIRALSRVLPPVFGGVEMRKFLSQTAINMRGAVGVSQDEMGEFASGVYVSHARVDSAVCDGPITEAEWASARECTMKFAEMAVRLDDQAIGLLRYAPSIKGWLKGKLGGQRDGSYEVSNLGVVGLGEGVKNGVKITEMVFAQPGHVVGTPMCFNIVSTKGGGLMYTLTWPKGAFGVEDEEEFGNQVCCSIMDGFELFR